MEGFFVTAVKHVGEQAVVGGKLRAGPIQAGQQLLGDGVCVADVDGLQLDQQIVAHRHRLGGLGGKPVQFSAARVREREHPLVGPPLLSHQAGIDKTVRLELVEFAVQLLGGRRPEVGDRHVEALRELITRCLAFQQGGEHCVTQRHLDRLPIAA